MKKHLFSILLALALLMTLTTTAWAANVGSWSELQGAINAASDNTPTTITLTQNITAGGGDAAFVIYVNKDITVELAGYTLNANGKDRIFRVKGKLTIQDSSEDQSGSLTGGSSVNGGAISIEEDGSFELKSGKITGNTASENGGAIDISNGTAIISGGSIEKNNAVNGGAIYVNTSCTCTVNAGSLSQNQATYGGAIYAVGTLELKGGRIEKNSATKDGGGLYLYGGTRSAGAVTISENSAQEKGGGICITTNTELTLKDGAKIEKNNALYGGGIFNEGSVTMNRAAIVSNKALSGGGVYLSKGSFVLNDRNASIARNQAASSDNAQLGSCNGGGIYVFGGTFTLNNGAIANNKALSGGGGIFARSDVQMNGGAIYGNSAEKFGGGIMVIGDGSSKGATPTKFFTMTDGRISNNTAKRRGGGVYVDYYNMAFVMTGGYITDNTAVEVEGNDADDAGGGGIWASRGLTVGGDAVVDSNKLLRTNGRKTDNDLFLPLVKFGEESFASEIKIDFSADHPLTYYANIGVTAEGELPIPVSVPCGDYSRYFHANRGGEAVVYRNGVLMLVEVPTDEGLYDVKLSITGAEGGLMANTDRAEAGEIVRITVTPDKGFALETLSVRDQNGNEIEIRDMGNGWFTFVMPKSDVSVYGSFMEDNEMLNFCVDVKASDYYYDAVLWAYEQGVAKGIDSTHFSPNRVVTRAEAVTLLWRAAGCPAPAGSASQFTDVKKGSYYAKAVAWGIEKGVVKGTSKTTFSPHMLCSRAHIVSFLARFAGVEDAETVTRFTDVQPSDYFSAAVKWAEDNGVTEGTTSTTFSPHKNCTRAEVVTFLYRWLAK